MELDLVSADQAIEDDVVIGLVKRGLEDWHERWLLVFDNYDSPSQFDDIQDFFPDGNVTIIISLIAMPSLTIV